MKNLNSKSWYIPATLLIANFLIRLLVYYNTTLFNFSDYSAYLNAIDNIATGGKQYLQVGNFLFSTSYMGFLSREITGSLDLFFIFNCLMGSLSGLIIYYMIVRITGLKTAGVAALIILSFYTEYMVFSSVFYTPVIMIFLVALFILMLYHFLTAKSKALIVFSVMALMGIFLLTFFFKPELKYLPLFLLLAGFLFIKKERTFSRRILVLAFLLFPFSFLLQDTGLISRPEGNIISNSFVFFGHTDYGGDGGEGSFIYPANEARYDSALNKYLEVNKIKDPGLNNYNDFQKQEIRKFVLHHPFRWAGLQFRKFFRTFGVVPESTSFRVLYTGLMKGSLWITTAAVVLPVAVLIVLFIFLFNIRGLRTRAQGSGHRAQYNEPPQLINDHRLPNTRSKTLFLYIYLLLFIYYLIACIFYGQYQERYRMPLMVLFIIPVLGYFIASFNLKEFLSGRALQIKAVVILLFLTVWVFQTVNAVSNKDRLKKALESIGNQYSVISNR